MEIAIRRVYDEPTEADGLRVLVDRLWPRGMAKERLDALWAKELAPSSELRSWMHEDPPGRFDEFVQRYLAELDGSGAVEEFVQAHGEEPVVTLLFSTRDVAHNHAQVLRQVILETVADDEG